ncbi:MAG: nucleotidyltransferase domain-containing protein [Candidatus Woesearchaeota archaeon]
MNLSFLDEIKKEITPKNTGVVKEFLSMIKVDGAKVTLGGSVAKGTNLEDFDVDVFVKFKENKDISKRLQSALKKFNPNIVHGSRDYFHINYKGLTFEFVPVLDLKYNKPENVIDMSPLHVDYFNSIATIDQKEDVRLLKKFCTSIGVYGAESHIKGFSGHVLCLLIIHYKSFESLLEKAKNWKPKVIIDIEKHHKHPLMVIDKSKTQGPLVVVDPVQKERNAAAALSLNSFNKFKSHAKKFLKNPSKDFFKEKNLDRLAKNTKNLVIKITLTIKGKQDVAGAKALKVKKFLESSIKLYHEIGFLEFKFKKQGFIFIEIKKTPKILKKQGPPLDKEMHVHTFKKLYPNFQLLENELYALVKNPKTDIKKYVFELLNSKYVKERAEDFLVTFLNDD